MNKDNYWLHCILKTIWLSVEFSKQTVDICNSNYKRFRKFQKKFRPFLILIWFFLNKTKYNLQLKLFYWLLNNHRCWELSDILFRLYLISEKSPSFSCKYVNFITWISRKYLLNTYWAILVVLIWIWELVFFERK